MKKYLTTISMVIAIIGITASVVLKDELFAISFLWILVENIKNFLDDSDKEK